MPFVAAHPLHTSSKVVRAITPTKASGMESSVPIPPESTAMWCDANKKTRFNHDLNKTLEQFKEIYDKRINNFLNDVQNTEKHVYFVYATDDKNLTQKHLDDLYMELVKYNHTAKLIVTSHADNQNIKSDDNIKVIYEPFALTKDWTNELLTTPQGRKFSENIINKIIDFIIK